MKALIVLSLVTIAALSCDTCVARKIQQAEVEYTFTVYKVFKDEKGEEHKLTKKAYRDYREAVEVQQKLAKAKHIKIKEKKGK